MVLLSQKIRADKFQSLKLSAYHAEGVRSSEYDGWYERNGARALPSIAEGCAETCWQGFGTACESLQLHSITLVWFYPRLRLSLGFLNLFIDLYRL